MPLLQGQHPVPQALVQLEGQISGHYGRQDADALVSLSSSAAKIHAEVGEGGAYGVGFETEKNNHVYVH